MKVKLLKRLRKEGMRQIDIHTTTRTNGIMSGMSYSYSDSKYKGLFNYGDSEFDVLKKAAHIYMEDYIKRIKDKNTSRI